MESMGTDVLSVFSSSFIFGDLGGMVVTALLVQALKSLAMDVYGLAALKRWHKFACSIVAGLVVAFAWGLHAEMSWFDYPKRAMGYAAFSGLFWNFVFKPFLEWIRRKRENRG
jgi:chromate transport protein ChrA